MTQRLLDGVPIRRADIAVGEITEKTGKIRSQIGIRSNSCAPAGRERTRRRSFMLVLYLCWMIKALR
jgi:hypothetical protein